MALEGMTETLKRTNNLCVSCHDFKAERTGNEFFRTRTKVERLLTEAGFKTIRRNDSDLPWLKFQVFAHK